MNDFSALGQEMTVVPASGGGFRLTALAPNGFLEHLGLRTGDIVRRIDGRPINSLDDAGKAYAWLRVTDNFTVEVTRDGQPVQLRFRVEG